jgi:hypothetical protein
VARDDWKQRWEAIGPERRRHVIRAVYRGEEVNDPRDAPLAVELVDRRKTLAARYIGSRWLSPTHVAFFAVLGLPLAFWTREFRLAVFGLLLALYLLGFGAWIKRLQARATLARDSNEKLTRLL